jgi:hypothetical protein
MTRPARFTKRCELIMTEEQFTQMERVRKSRNLSSNYEVLRHGLAVYDFVSTEISKGHQLYIKNGNGELVRVEFL